MNVLNVMNFVRACDERSTYVNDNLFRVTAQELALVNELDIENTFLLQYDAFCDERFVQLFKTQANAKTELGVWLEIVEPMTTACGLPYNSQNGWKWDWHIIPGLPMGYTPKQREWLVDETMRKFREVFGYYPRTVGGWLIDTYTMNYMCERYEIDAICICRDQLNTDAYTLLGGYFNGAYYPSKKNIFTPAQSEAYRVGTPVFKLLGPCPICNYDDAKFMDADIYALRRPEGPFPCTLEPVCPLCAEEAVVDWFYKTYFDNENLGFSAIQTGQENSFAAVDFIPALRMQLEKAVKLEKQGKLVIRTYGDTGAWFKQTYKQTPPTAVCAIDSWDGSDVQSIYYDCKSYMANLFRCGNVVFIRQFHLFDERITDDYMHEVCTRFDAVYETLPIVDTVLWQKGRRDGVGLILSTNASSMVPTKEADGALAVRFAQVCVRFTETGIHITGAATCSFSFGTPTAHISVSEHTLSYEYKGHAYALDVQHTRMVQTENGITFDGNDVRLIPRKM